MDHRDKPVAAPASNAAVVVTGGASGIGLATTLALLRHGRSVVVADADAAALRDLPGKLEGHADACLALQCDVTDEPGVERMVADAVRRFGRITGLVQSAGIGMEMSFLETSAIAFRRVLDVNLLGSFIVARSVAQHMVQHGGGAIVNIASASGLVGNALRTAYGASKGGVIAMTKVMAVELAEAGIRVNAVAPGAIETPLVKTMHSQQTRDALVARIPQRRYGTPDEVAALVATLLDDTLSGYCTGQIIAIDGGMTAAGLMAAAPRA